MRQGTTRPGGRSARIRSAVMGATLGLLAERGFDAVEIPAVARRAGVHPTTVYRRWPSKARLVGEAMLEREGPLSPTPDTGALRTDLVQLLVDGALLLRTPQVRALLAVILGAPSDASADVLAARDRFITAHLEEVRKTVDRAVARAELPSATDPQVLLDLLIGPVLLRVLLLGTEVGPDESASIVDRALTVLAAEAEDPAGASRLSSP